MTISKMARVRSNLESINKRLEIMSESSRLFGFTGMMNELDRIRGAALAQVIADMENECD